MKKCDIPNEWKICYSDYKKWKSICSAIEEGRIPECPKGFSVDEWISYLREQRMLGVIYPKLKFKQGGGHQEGQYIDKIKSEYIIQKCLMVQRNTELKNILSALKRQNIEVAMIKGLYLQNCIYKNGEIRQSNDIDLLCLDKSKYRESIDLISGIGYRKYLYFSNSWENRFMKSVTLIPCQPGIYSEVDIHRSLLYGKFDRRRLVDEVLMNPECYHQKKIGQYTARVMDPGTSYLYMAYHMFCVHHKVKKLIWLYDLILLSKHFDRNDERFQKIVREAKMEKLIEYVFDMIDEIIIPEDSGTDKFCTTKNIISPQRDKLKNINGVSNKMLWLMLWLFPSKGYLKGHFKSDKPIIYLRMKYIIKIIKGILTTK